jgi:hypothetical protein
MWWSRKAPRHSLKKRPPGSIPPQKIKLRRRSKLKRSNNRIYMRRSSNMRRIK